MADKSEPVGIPNPFTELVTDMVETVRKLGPSPLNKVEKPESKVQAK